MTDYPYSQQIYDKVINDWKDVPIEEFNYDRDFISHPSINYRLWKGCMGLYPENLISCVSKEHGASLCKTIYDEPLERKRKLQTQLAVKQFLGL